MTKALILSLFAIASGAYPSTISTFSISTVATSSSGVETDPCSLSGSGAGTASCSSVGGGSSFDHANASVTLTDNSIQISLSSHMDASTEGFASITHDDFYTAPVNGPVSAVLSLTCNNFLGASGAFTTVGHFSLGSTSVSPPVESIYTGASQGSGPCGVQDRLPGPPGFTGAFNVSLSAVNNIVHLHTYIDASGFEVDNSGGIFVQLTVNGFQDANGNPIAATLLTPEPTTLGMFGLSLLVGVGMRAKRNRSGTRAAFPNGT